MGLTADHSLGRLQKFFSKTEGTAGTFEKPVATDAAKVTKATFGWQPERTIRNATRQTRSALERVTGKIMCPWSVEAEIVPSGTAGTPPDLHPLYKAALGSYTNTPGTSDAYAPSDSQVRDTVSMTSHYPDVLMQSIWGALVETMTLSIQGGSIPTVKWDGPSMGHAHTGTSTLNGAMVATPTMIVQTADAWNFEINSVVQVGSEDNSSAGFKVTADSSRPSFTLEASVTNQIDTSAVIPFTPTETTAGTTLMGISGSASIDAGSIDIVGIDVTVKQNLKTNEDEALQQYISDAIPGWREVTGELTFKARKDWVIYWAERKDLTTSKDIQVIAGSSAGHRLQIDLNQVEFDFTDLDVPTDDTPTIFSVPFTALGSSGADEITLTFT